MRCMVPPVMNAVECMGCGTVWLEYDGRAVERCPGCSRVNMWGNVTVNSERCPDVTMLYDPSLLVVWDERSKN